jgi:putative aldouronate transport system permease protein
MNLFKNTAYNVRKDKLAPYGLKKNNIFSNIAYDLKKNKILLLMLLPTVLYFFIFNYVPMAGIVIAFKRLDYSLGIFNSPWIGLDNFKFFFVSGQAWKVTRNTVLYNAAFIVVGTTLQIALAIFLSELGSKFFKKTTQAMMFLPYFISWVVGGAIVYSFFNYEFGTFNAILKGMGKEPVDINMAVGAWKYILVFFHTWKGVGYGTVIYLAAIMGIDSEIYEAAEIDGANIFDRVFRITLPSLKQTVIILTLLAIGNIFRGDFGLFWNTVGRNGMLFDATDVIDTFTFRSLMQASDFGMAAAAGLYQSALCFVIITVTNKIVKTVDKDYALF